MEPITTAAQAMKMTAIAQQAFNVIFMVGLNANINPLSGCAKNGTQFDYIIVGGGTAGSVLGNRLSADPTVSVLVIEAGGNYETEVVVPYVVVFTQMARFDWNYRAEFDKNFAQCHENKLFRPTVGKLLGGGSGVNYMMYSQGYDRDYNNWAKITKEPSWRFKNIQRLFKKIERFNDDEIENSPDAIYHGFQGNLGLTKDRSKSHDKFFKAISQMGYKEVTDINNGTKLGFTGVTFYIDDGIRQNSAYAFLYPVRNRTNLIVLKETQVTKIIINKSKRAVGVIAVTKDNRTFVFKAKREVIVTAGTYNTPKLLQLSGIGPKKLLKSLNIPCVANLPVGLNYHGHVGTVLLFAVDKVCTEFVPEQNNPKNFPAPVFEGYVALNKSDQYPDYRVLNFLVQVTPAPIFLQYTTYLYQFANELMDCAYNRAIGKEILYTVVGNTKPVSRGKVFIRSTNPFDPPKIDTKFYDKEKDVEDMVRYVKDYMRILNTDVFRQAGAFFIDPVRGKCIEFEEYSDDYWRCYVRCLMAPQNHNAGTAAMGTVTDGRLRVKGVKGLRVADASVMPEIIPGSPTVPVMVIGQNAAEMIIEDNKRKN